MTGPAQLVFVGADALNAVLDRTAPDHLFIREFWRFELDAGSTLMITDATLLKVSLDVQSRYGLAAVERLFRDVVPALRVERCTAGDLDAALASLAAAGDAGRDLVRHLEDRVRTRLHVVRTLSSG